MIGFMYALMFMLALFHWHLLNICYMLAPQHLYNAADEEVAHWQKVMDKIDVPILNRGTLRTSMAHMQTARCSSINEGAAAASTAFGMPNDRVPGIPDASNLASVYKDEIPDVAHSSLYLTRSIRRGNRPNIQGDIQGGIEGGRLSLESGSSFGSIVSMPAFASLDQNVLPKISRGQSDTVEPRWSTPLELPPRTLAPRRGAQSPGWSAIRSAIGERPAARKKTATVMVTQLFLEKAATFNRTAGSIRNVGNAGIPEGSVAVAIPSPTTSPRQLRHAFSTPIPPSGGGRDGELVPLLHGVSNSGDTSYRHPHLPGARTQHHNPLPSHHSHGLRPEPRGSIVPKAPSNLNRERAVKLDFENWLHHTTLYGNFDVMGTQTIFSGPFTCLPGCIRPHVRRGLLRHFAPMHIGC